MPRSRKSAAPAPRPAPAALLAECAALPLAARVAFARRWAGGSEARCATLSAADRDVSHVLALSALAWTSLIGVRDALTGGKGAVAKLLWPSFVASANDASAAAARAGITLPPAWFRLRPEPPNEQPPQASPSPSVSARPEERRP